MKKIIFGGITILSAATPAVAISCSLSNHEKISIEKYFEKFSDPSSSDPITVITIGNAHNLPSGSNEIPKVMTSYANETIVNSTKTIDIGGSNLEKSLKGENGRLGFISIEFNPRFNDADMNQIKNYTKRISQQIAQSISSPMIIAIRFQQDLGAYKDEQGFWIPLSLNTTGQKWYSLYSFINEASEIWNEKLHDLGKDIYGHIAEDNKLFWYPEPHIKDLLITMQKFGKTIPFVDEKF